MERVLVILPHPDDEVFGLSGTLAQLIDQGAIVTYACLTLGEMGRNMGFPPFASRVTLPQIRRGELEESCAAIGIQDLRMLGFHDKTIEFEDKVFLDEHIHALIEEVKPDVIFTFYPGYSVHPDHDATGEAVVRTVGRLPEADRPPVYCMAFSRDHEQAIGKPDISFDVRDYLKNKLAALRAHRSQFQAADIIGSKQHTDKEIRERFGTERFWTYKFETWK
ncbi:bacillithiol biosynthesis deacetylase BshB2 [Paenibacillus glycanilyticus]|uniref:Bacillithiol biosynthesis deacetylase BshB2 n=1 Tax=Paenibacillus glycanilyticus TaxID=126569 RepID=A0ABQ6GA46_9BACL|nr:bacillithiol biosynthesis deacetylase BshB2 [Paenibacillus glycanilyticus]GLX67783.1 bacillithiol biosynthesis deacetylase BshB2 [Paenibacillus glycanilyticus]